MQNYWVPAASIWQISSYHFLHFTGMLFYWWKEDKCIHIVIAPEGRRIKQEWKRSGTSFEQMSKLLALHKPRQSFRSALHSWAFSITQTAGGQHGP